MKKWPLIPSSRLDKTVFTWKWEKELVHQSPWDLCVTLLFLNSKVECYLHEGGDVLKELDDMVRIRLRIESASWRRWKKKERRPLAFSKSLKSKCGVCVGLELLVAKIDEKIQYNASESLSTVV